MQRSSAEGNQSNIKLYYVGQVCINCSRLDVETLDYAEVAQFAVLEYTKKQIWGKIARWVIGNSRSN